MMQQTEEFGYVVGEGFQAIELPYVGGRTSMLILLPDAGTFESFEASLDAEQMDAIVQQVERRNMVLTMPRFTFETRLDLAQILAGMGMESAFDPGAANFSGMDGSRELFIQGVLHKAFVAVDEAGTEAAAATAVLVGITAMPEEPIEVTVDRPFIFAIRDTETGAILFLGRVVNPGS
ncbi:MAG TPA: serpin family protein, partial [Chloroflexi bacterium]|nr:serpin family protein [Chloroflexota bacterium]